MNVAGFVPDMDLVLQLLAATAVLGFIFISWQTINRLDLRFSRELIEAERTIETCKALIAQKSAEIEALQMLTAEIEARCKKFEQDAHALDERLKGRNLPYRFTCAILENARRDRDREFYFWIRNDQIVARARPGSESRAWERGRRYVSFGQDMRQAFNRLEEHFPKQSGYFILPE